MVEHGSMGVDQAESGCVFKSIACNMVVRHGFRVPGAAGG